MVAVADCERNQTQWLLAQARAAGGSTWTDGSLTWVGLGTRGDLNLLFPRAIDTVALGRGLERARREGRETIGAWLSLDVDSRPLADAGFERGWAPRWMTRPLTGLRKPTDDRLRLETDSPEYDEHGQRLLALAREQPPHCWHAVARVEGKLVGRAWSHLDGAFAGIYDMWVAPAFQRRGLGSSLLGAVLAVAKEAGATEAVLNATADGERLYLRHGFELIGEGITWWRHRAT